MAKINEYLTVGEAAELLGVSKDTLRRWDRAGKLKAHRHPITDYRLYLRVELEAVLKQIRQGNPLDDSAKGARKSRSKDGGL